MKDPAHTIEPHAADPSNGGSAATPATRAGAIRKWWVRCRCWWHRRLQPPVAFPADASCPTCGRPANGKPQGGEERRSEVLKSWTARGIVGTVLALSLVTISSVLTVAFHALLPARFHYLDPEQLEAIRTFLAVMLVSSLLSDYARRLLER